MSSPEIVWRTARGDTAGVTVHAPDATDPHQLRVVIGPGLTLRLPRIEARLLSMALLDAANTPPLPAPRKVIPIHSAPPSALYHEPEEETPCPN